MDKEKLIEEYLKMYEKWKNTESDDELFKIFTTE